MDDSSSCGSSSDDDDALYQISRLPSLSGSSKRTSSEADLEVASTASVSASETSSRGSEPGRIRFDFDAPGGKVASWGRVGTASRRRSLSATGRRSSLNDGADYSGDRDEGEGGNKRGSSLPPPSYFRHNSTGHPLYPPEEPSLDKSPGARDGGPGLSDRFRRTSSAGSSRSGMSSVTEASDGAASFVGDVDPLDSPGRGTGRQSRPSSRRSSPGARGASLPVGDGRKRAKSALRTPKYREDPEMMARQMWATRDVVKMSAHLDEYASDGSEEGGGGGRCVRTLCLVWYGRHPY